MDDGAPQYPIQSVDNALRVLLMLESSPTVRLSDVAAQLGVARSTAHRLLAVLQHRGFVAREPGSKAYRAGGALIEVAVGAAATLDVRGIALPHLQRLRDEVGETTHLMMLEGPAVRFVADVEGPQALRVGGRTGLRLPAYATSGGKALLAQLAPSIVDVLYPRTLRRLTDETIADRAVLHEELARVRAQGYGANFGESEHRVSGVGVCVRGPAGRPVAALAVAAPSDRLTPRTAARVVASVAREAERFAVALGGREGGMTPVGPETGRERADGSS